MKCLSDFRTCGFDVAEITAFLARRGISIGNAPTTLAMASDNAFPEWKRVMALLPHLTETEAASAFANIDLTAPGWLSDDEQAELSRWKTVIDRAARAEELLATSMAESEWSIGLPDLAEWCAKKGWPYPLPGGVKVPATDAGLRDALLICEKERSQWKVKAEARETSDNHRANLQIEIEQLRAGLRKKTDEIAALEHERNVLKTDALSGKSKSTALKIIGGLAIEAYRMSIHTERLEGIGEMVKDLEKAGAGVTEKTLREWIKEAAKVIDPLQRK